MLPINITELLEQNRIESNQIKYKKGWNPIRKIVSRILKQSVFLFNLITDKCRVFDTLDNQVEVRLIEFSAKLTFKHFYSFYGNDTATVQPTFVVQPMIVLFFQWVLALVYFLIARTGSGVDL